MAKRSHEPVPRAIVGDGSGEIDVELHSDQITHAYVTY